MSHPGRPLGLAPDVVLAAQTTGAAVGNAIAPGNVLLGASTVGIPDRTGAIIRLTLPTWRSLWG